MTYYLYTRGTKDIPSQKLADMLHYLEESTLDNATYKDLTDVHSMINRIKKNREVGIRYMHTWDREFWLQETAREEGIFSARRNCILELLGRLGDIPANIAEIINSCTDEPSLKNMHFAAAEAKTFDEFLAEIN